MHRGREGSHGGQRERHADPEDRPDEAAECRERHRLGQQPGVRRGVLNVRQYIFLTVGTDNPVRLAISFLAPPFSIICTSSACVHLEG